MDREQPDAYTILLTTRRFVFAATLGCALLFGAPSARATVTYVYTGNFYTYYEGPYTASDYVHGSITLTAALAPNLTEFDISAIVTSFLFHDFSTNVLPVDSAVPPAGFLLAPLVSTDGSGNITYWKIVVTDGGSPLHIITTYSTPGYGSYDSPIDEATLNAQDPPRAWNVNSPGTWAVIPEPSTLLLVGSGILGVAISSATRRR